MDLAWHTHQACPLDYARYTAAILGGRVLPHDDSVNDRAPGSRLRCAETVTRELWRRHLGPDASFSKPGAMFRGAPPHGRLRPVTIAEQTAILRGQVGLLDLTKLSFQGASSSTKKVTERDGQAFKRMTISSYPEIPSPPRFHGRCAV